MVRISIAVIKCHNQKQLVEERVYFKLTVPHHNLLLKEVRTGTEGKNLEAGTKAEAREESFLLACSACFLDTQDHQPGIAPPTNELGPPPLITN